MEGGGRGEVKGAAKSTGLDEVVGRPLVGEGVKLHPPTEQHISHKGWKSLGCAYNLIDPTILARPSVFGS